MKCVNHLEAETASTCSLCGRPYCGECLVNIDNQTYCKNCLREKLTPADRQEAGPEGQGKSAADPRKITDKKSRFWAFVFSVVPGVGYMYLGLMNRGLQTMVLFFGSVFVSSFIGLEQIMALIAPVVVFYSIFDTQQLVKAINAGVPAEDKKLFDIKQIPFNQSWIGYALIVIGGLAILNDVIPYFPFWFQVKRLLGPLLIVGLGVAILYRNTKKI